MRKLIPSLFFFLGLGGLARGTPPGPPLLIAGLNPGEAPLVVDGAEVPPASADRVVWQEGHGLMLVGAGKRLALPLAEGLPVDVEVRGPGGALAPGVRLCYRPVGLPNLPEPMGRVRTGVGGDARLWARAGEELLVWVEEPGYLPFLTKIPAGAGKAVMSLKPASSAVIRVRDAYGRGLAGAKLKMLILEAFSNPVRLVQDLRDGGGTNTRELAGDAAGCILLPPSLPPSCGVVTAPGCLLEEVPEVSRSRDVVLGPAPALSLVVRDIATKAVVPEAEYTLWAAPKSLPLLVVEAHGACDLGRGVLRPPRLPCRVEVRAKGFVPKLVSVGEEGVLGVVELERGVTFRGMVVDPAGKAVGKASVAWRSQQVQTDGQGRFELPPLPPSEVPFTLEVGAEGFLDGRVDGLTARDTAPLRIVLDRGAGVVGRVVDEETRQPLPQAKVTLYALAGHSSQGVCVKANLDDEANFQVTGLEPGEYDLRAFARERTASIHKVTLRGAETRDLGEIVLSDHPAVTGKLEAPEGVDLSAGAEVHLERIVSHKEVAVPTTDATPVGKVDSDGSFRIAGVAAGRYRLLAADGPLKRALAPVDVERDNVDVGSVVLTDSCSLRGRLVSDRPRPLGSWRVTLMAQAFDESPPTSLTSEDGSFSFEDLAAGEYRLQAYPPLQLVPDAQQDLHLDPGEAQDVVIPLGGVRITVFLQVVGRPAGGATLTVTAGSRSLFDEGVVCLNGSLGQIILGLPSIPHSATADATGRASLEGLSPGEAQAILSLEGMTYLSPVAIPAEPSGPLTWNFPGVEVRGKVVQVDGSPGAGLVVSAGYSGGTLFAVKSGPDGSFTIAGLGEGAVTLGCRDDAGHAGTVTVRLAAGEPPPSVTLQLQARAEGGSK